MNYTSFVVYIYLTSIVFLYMSVMTLNTLKIHTWLSTDKVVNLTWSFLWKQLLHFCKNRSWAEEQRKRTACSINWKITIKAAQKWHQNLVFFTCPLIPLSFKAFMSSWVSFWDFPSSTMLRLSVPASFVSKRKGYRFVKSSSKHFSAGETWFKFHRQQISPC